MGCGASTKNTASATNDMIAANATTTNSDNISKVTHTNKVNILIASHTTEHDFSKQLCDGLVEQGFLCYRLDENYPTSLGSRAQLIQWCDLFVLLVNRLYPRTFACMEAVNYAKDIRKPLVSVLVEPTFRPYGALGALSASAMKSILVTDHQSTTPIGDAFVRRTISEVTDIARNQIKPPSIEKNRIDLAEIENNNRSIQPPQSASTCVVLICTSDDGATVAKIVFDSLISTQSSTIVENMTDSSASSSVANCKVLVPILTPQFEQASLCRSVLEQACLLNKSIVPVIAVKKWRPDSWLGLIIAGRIFFRIFDQETAYQPFYDSNRMTDLRLEIETACQPAPTLDEREEIEKKAIEKEIERCKSQLSSWPPQRKSRIISSLKAREPVRIQIPEPQAQGEFDHTHYSFTRIDRKAPPPLLDSYGLPKRRPLDCMISYQWDKQNFVRDVFEDLHYRRVQTWFDIWGSMQGGTNDAMATGVECAKVLLVFLSKTYVESVNCLLEFRYAMQGGKAFVALFTESDIPMEQWMLNALEGFPQYYVYSYDILKELINGVPMIDVIVQSIRLLAEAQPSDSIDDCSNELFELRCLLDDARDALCSETGQTRYKTCTRCEQIYDMYAPDGCKKHAEYFLGGGGLLEDQWVCCRQQTADSPGCIPCTHIDQPRVFVEDPRYGSSSWKPS